MTHPTADYLNRIQRREHERHHSALFKLVGAGVPEHDFVEGIKVFGDMIEFHGCNGVDFFVPAHQIKLITHNTPDPSKPDDHGWIIHI